MAAPLVAQHAHRAEHARSEGPEGERLDHAARLTPRLQERALRPARRLRLRGGTSARSCQAGHVALPRARRAMQRGARSLASSTCSHVACSLCAAGSASPTGAVAGGGPGGSSDRPAATCGAATSTPPRPSLSAAPATGRMAGACRAGPTQCLSARCSLKQLESSCSLKPGCSWERAGLVARWGGRESGREGKRVRSRSLAS